jgi:hypothetical protein
MLSLEPWFQAFYQSHGIAYAIVHFTYVHLAKYSGLEFGRVLPNDRLDEDLHWSQVCWFDWETHLLDDFWNYFGVDISDCLDLDTIQTINDLVIFLDRYVTDHSSASALRNPSSDSFLNTEHY